MLEKPPIPQGGVHALSSVPVALLMLFLSCSNTLDRESYIRWVRNLDNGLHVRKSVSEFIIDVQYQPLQYRLLQAGEDLSPTDQKNLADNSSNTQYYTLSISVKDNSVDFINYGIRDIREKQIKSYYFSYQFQQDITLEQNGKELACVLFHFERPVNNSCTFVLGFENAEPSEEAILIIRSDQFNSLPIRIKVSKNNIPSLAI